MCLRNSCRDGIGDKRAKKQRAVLWPIMAACHEMRSVIDHSNLVLEYKNQDVCNLSFFIRIWAFFNLTWAYLIFKVTQCCHSLSFVPSWMLKWWAFWRIHHISSCSLEILVMWLILHTLSTIKCSYQWGMFSYFIKFIL